MQLRCNGVESNPWCLYIYPFRFARMHQRGLSVSRRDRWCVTTLRHWCSAIHGVAEKDVWSGDKVKVVGISGDPVAKQYEFVRRNQLTVRAQCLLSACDECDPFHIVVSDPQRREGRSTPGIPHRPEPVWRSPRHLHHRPQGHHPVGGTD